MAASGIPGRHVAPRWTLFALVVFSLATGLLYGRVWTEGPGRVVPTQPSSARMQPVVEADHQWVVWAVSRNARTLVTRPDRLFDAEQCFPSEKSLAFGEPVAALGLLAAPVRILVRDPVVTYNTALALSALAAAMAMFWLVATWSGEPAAGVVAGFLYAFTGLAVSDVIHPYASDTTGAVLALVFGERVVSGGRWRDALGLAAAASFQVGTSFYPLVAAFLLLLPCGSWMLVAHRRRASLLPQAGFVLVAVGLTGRWLLGPYLEMRDLGVLRDDVPAQFLPWVAHAPSGAAFFGWIGLCLAALGLAIPARFTLPRVDPGTRWALVAGAILCAGVAAGPAAPIDLHTPLASWLPGLDTVRLPHKIAIGAHLALCALAGLGTAGVLRLAVGRRPSLARPLPALCAAFVCVVLAALSLPEHAALAIRPPEEAVAFHRALAASGNAGPIHDTPVPGGPERYTWSGTAGYLLLAEFHRRPTSACYSSHPPPHRGQLEAIERRLPGRDAVGELARLGFTTIVVHHPRSETLPRRRRVAFERAAERAGSPLRLIRASPSLTAYEIAPQPPRGSGSAAGLR